MILVTGSNGFVGSALCVLLRARGETVVAAVRQGGGAGVAAVGELDGDTDWRAALAGCDTVVHLAARVHMMAEADSDPLAAYRRVNVEASVNLARQAVAAGVRRLVFVSSVKVNGEATSGAPFRADDAPAPQDPYGVSKLEAEQALLALGRASGLEVVVVRPPLVYGPGAKANFLSLIKLVAKGLPLPFGRARGMRSLVALDNLTDLLALCCRHPHAPGRVFMVSDGADLTVADLARMIARAMGKRAMLVPVPVGWMRAALGALGRGGVAERLFGSLQVDIAATQAALEWRPLVAPQQAIDQTVSHFLTFKGKK